MDTKMVDVTIHIDEQTTRSEREALRDKLLNQNGVLAADFNKNKPHLIIVEYDPDVIAASKLLNIVEQLELHGELVGL